MFVGFSDKIVQDHQVILVIMVMGLDTVLELNLRNGTSQNVIEGRRRYHFHRDNRESSLALTREATHLLAKQQLGTLMPVSWTFAL